MSRNVSVDSNIVPFLTPEIPENAPIEIPLLGGTEGMRPSRTQVYRDPAVATRLLGVQYDSNGVLRTGLGVIYNANVLSGTILSNFTYRTNDSVYRIVATTVGIAYTIGTYGSYTYMTGDAFSGLYSGDWFDFTPWGDKLICTNPIVGMYEIDLVAHTYTKITEAPQDAQTLQVFNGRLVATNMANNPRRVQWSVKFDSNDWTGLGSGFEDLQGVNTYSGNYPLRVIAESDTVALVFRQDSCDMMQATDRFDSPFVFSSLHRNLPSISTRAIARAKVGTVTVNGRGVYVVTPSNATLVGEGLTTTADIGLLDVNYGLRIPTRKWFGAYHPGTDEYWLQTEYATYRYQFKYNSWVEFEATAGYPVAISPADGAINGPYNGLIGDYASQIGNFGDLTNISQGPISIAVGQYDYLYDTYNANPAVQIETSDIDLTVRNKQVTIQEFELEYYCDNAQTYTVEYSIDSGASWSTYGTITSSGTVFHSRLATIRKVVTGKQIRFRLSCNSNSKATRFTYMIMRGVVGTRNYAHQ